MLLLNNARVNGEIVDIRIADGLIAEIGRLDGEGTDLGGRIVVPGLWDNHVHFSQWALRSQRFDLSAASSAAEAAAMVGTTATGPLFVGGGFRDAL